MLTNTQKDKVKVFISSKIDSKYNIMRAALAAMLEETGLVSTYVFETAGSSSQELVEGYLEQLEDSDLCIFIIANQDGIPDGVQKEYRRAVELQKKALYFFCMENQAQATYMQKEIEQRQDCKYQNIPLFADIAQTVYHDAIQDILKIYRSYCGGHLIHKDRRIEEKSSEDVVLWQEGLQKSTLPEETPHILEKTLIHNYDKTKKTLLDQICRNMLQIENTSPQDEICLQLLSVILGDVLADTLDFNLIKKVICSRDSLLMNSVLELRVEAIRAYFSDDPDACISFLTQAYETGKQGKEFPNWLLNDISIDLRNIQIEVDDNHNQICFETPGQQQLDQNPEQVYYPLLDRFTTNAYETLIKQSLDEQMISPYTVKLGGIENLFDDMINAFIVAMQYGSITQMLDIRNNLLRIVESMNLIYHDHELHLFLIRLFLISHKKKELQQYVHAYGERTEKINATDMKKLWAYTDHIWNKKYRMMSQLLFWEQYGYYFSDEDYQKYTELQIAEIDNWIFAENKIISIGDYIYDALLHNVLRLEQERILALCYKTIENGLMKWADKVFQIVAKLSIKKMNTADQRKCIQWLQACMEDKDIRNHHERELKKAMIQTRLKTTVSCVRFDRAVKKVLPNFYSEQYVLNVYDQTEEEDGQYIHKYLQQQHKRNDEQGLNGRYAGYGNEPFSIIRNIITRNHMIVSENMQDKIMQVTEETLLAPKQTSWAKINAFHMMLFMAARYPGIHDRKQYAQGVVQREDIIENSHKDFMIKQATKSSLQFAQLLAQVAFGEYSSQNLLFYLSELSILDTASLISCMETIYLYLDNTEPAKIPQELLSGLTQSLIGLSRNEEEDVRYKAVLCILCMCRTKYRDMMLSQMSLMMDDETCLIKTVILRRIKQVEGNGKLTDYIIQKGKTDNHYWVRQLSGEASCDKD